MIIRQTSDLAEINAILTDDDIYQRITQDLAPAKADYQATLKQSAIFLIGDIDQQNFALMIFDRKGPICYDCHIQVLPQYRDHAFEFANSCFNWLWENTEAQKITAEIALIFPEVLMFAKKCGFEVEGINKKSFIKNGQVYDQVYMGLTNELGSRQSRQFFR